MTLGPWLRQKIREEYGLKAADSPAFPQAIETVAMRRGTTPDEVVRGAWIDSALRLEIAAAMSVGESYFMRHSEHEDAIRKQVESVLTSGRRACVWSAGCSRGEEPFSAGMVLIERFGPGVRPAIDIEATDIDALAIEAGRSGVFGPWSLRGIDASRQARYFRKAEGGFRISDELRSWVRFSHCSLQARLLDIPSSSVDLILFRNVGIYLTPDALASIHDGFARVLAPDGLLLQAATDPAPPVGNALSRWAEGPFGSYRLPAAKSEPPRQDRPKRRQLTKAAVGARTGPWPLAAKTSGEQPVAKHDEDDGSATAPSISRASALADAGLLGDAIALVDRLIAKHPRQRSAYVLRAQLRLHQHDCEGAVEDLRRALFLHPGDCLARYWYSVALAEAGRLQEAEAQRRVLASHLADRRGDERLSDGETTIDDLRALLPSPAKELA